MGLWLHDDESLAAARARVGPGKVNGAPEACRAQWTRGTRLSPGSRRMVRPTLRILAIRATMIPPDFEGMEVGGGVGKAIDLPFPVQDLLEVGGWTVALRQHL